MTRTLTILLSLFLIAGCASTTKLSPEIAADIQQAKVAAAFYMEGKKINYDEMVYKVLWNENRSQQSVFEGSWDVDREVTSTFSNSLQSIGFAAEPMHQVLDNSLYSEFEQAILNTRGSDGMNVSMNLSSELRDTLLEGNIGYVVLLRAAHYQVQKVSGFKPQFSMPSMLMVYDVARNEQSYNGMFPVGGAVAVEKSPREVEANNLAKLKTATHEWVDQATTTRLPDALGLAAN